MARLVPDLDLRPHLDQARTRVLALRNRWQRSPMEPLTLPLVAALLVNGVGLSLLQMRQNRLVTAQEAATPTEDTSQLLELSEGLEVTSGLNSVEVPIGDSLPPPPPDLLADTPGGAFPFSSPPSSDVSEAAGSDSGTPEPDGTPPAPGNARAETEETPNPEPDDPQVAENSSAGLLILTAENDNPYDASWEAATAQGTPPAELQKIPPSLALRSLPLATARLAGLPVIHGQSVLLDDRLYLLWVKGTTLWLMRTELGSARAGAGKAE